LAYWAGLPNFEAAIMLHTPDGSALAGDFDGDGSVTGADLPYWSGGFGADGNVSAGHGNADGDSDVDGNDFLVWQRQLGASQTAVAIPEPTSLLFAAVGALAFLSSMSPRRGSCPNREAALV
jgi:hypothetical protein